MTHPPVEPTPPVEPVETKRVIIVVAYADNRVIGRDGEIPWRISADMRHFRETTMGHTLVMGRTTYDSIGRPLPGRSTIVLTRDPSWSAPGVEVAHSLADAFVLAQRHDGDIVVAGGGQVYAEALPHATHLVLTEVRRSIDGDARFPEIDPDDWRKTRREDHDELSWVWLERR
ncbi:MAG TPA: dihydrofolate reductase [Nocardioidaceae bacterium]|nr:dihydrofolate reductase [Nocardioidaceae bacterium]